MTRARCWPRLLALALVSATLSGCAVHGLAFEADHRVKIVSPRDQAPVHLPVHLVWTSTIPANSRLEYAVFVDSHPMRPGQTIEDWIPSTDPCHHTAGCPNQTWLEQRFVFITTAHSLTLPLLPTLPASGGQSAENTHNVTIVLLDRRTGRRAGESAFLTTFQLVGFGAQS